MLIHTCTHTHMLIHRHTHTRSHRHTLSHTHTQTLLYTHAHLYRHSLIHIHGLSHVHAHTYTDTLSYTQTHAFIHTHTDTHIHSLTLKHTLSLSHTHTDAHRLLTSTQGEDSGSGPPGLDPCLHWAPSPLPPRALSCCPSSSPGPASPGRDTRLLRALLGARGGTHACFELSWEPGAPWHQRRRLPALTDLLRTAGT